MKRLAGCQFCHESGWWLAGPACAVRLRTVMIVSLIHASTSLVSLRSSIEPIAVARGGGIGRDAERAGDLGKGQPAPHFEGDDFAIHCRAIGSWHPGSTGFSSRSSTLVSNQDTGHRPARRQLAPSPAIFAAGPGQSPGGGRWQRPAPAGAADRRAAAGKPPPRASWTRSCASASERACCRAKSRNFGACSSNQRRQSACCDDSSIPPVLRHPPSEASPRGVLSGIITDSPPAFVGADNAHPLPRPAWVASLRLLRLPGVRRTASAPKFLPGRAAAWCPGSE